MLKFARSDTAMKQKKIIMPFSQYLVKNVGVHFFATLLCLNVQTCALDSNSIRSQKVYIFQEKKLHLG